MAAAVAGLEAAGYIDGRTDLTSAGRFAYQPGVLPSVGIGAFELVGIAVLRTSRTANFFGSIVWGSMPRASMTFASMAWLSAQPTKQVAEKRIAVFMVMVSEKKNVYVRQIDQLCCCGCCCSCLCCRIRLNEWSAQFVPGKRVESTDTEGEGV